MKLSPLAIALVCGTFLATPAPIEAFVAPVSPSSSGAAGRCSPAIYPRTNYRARVAVAAAPPGATIRGSIEDNTSSRRNDAIANARRPAETPPNDETKRGDHSSNNIVLAPPSRGAIGKCMAPAAAAAALLATTALVFSPMNIEPANAVLGAGGAVVSSPTIVKAITLEEWVNLPEKKQRQYEGGFLSCSYDSVFPSGFATSSAADAAKKPAKAVKAGAKVVKVCRPTNLIDDLLADIEELKVTDPDKADKFKAGAANLLARQRLVDRRSMEAELGKQPEVLYFTCALLASCVSTSIMHPLDTLKVRLMSGKGGEDASEQGAEDGDDGEGDNAFSALTGLYDGIVPNLLKEGPASALYLGIYEYARTRLEGVPFLADNVLLVYLLAGSIGEFVGSVFRSPAEAIKTRVQAGLYDVPGAVENVFLTEEGRKNTFFAWSAGVFRDVPHGAILIATFEISKTLIVDSSLDIDVNTLLSEALLGGLGGGLGAFVSTPSDVVTTKIITSIEDGGEPPNPIDTLAKVWNEGGVAGLFAGYKERIIYWTMSYGIFLSVYCSLRQYALVLFQ